MTLWLFYCQYRSFIRNITSNDPSGNIQMITGFELNWCCVNAFISHKDFVACRPTATVHSLRDGSTRHWSVVLCTWVRLTSVCLGFMNNLSNYAPKYRSEYMVRFAAYASWLAAIFAFTSHEQATKWQSFRCLDLPAIHHRSPWTFL